MADVIVRRPTGDIRVRVGGAPGPRGFASGPLGAESVGAEEINGGDLTALRDKLGISGQVVALTGDLTVARFAPRPGDAYQLNGHTLTIERMVDTEQVGIFRGAGSVVIKSGLARPEWWQTTSYRAAAIALMAGGGGTVMFDNARYPSESSFANPLPLSNVRFLASRQPDYVAGFTALTGGSILEAPVIFASQNGSGGALGMNVVVDGIGVDAGETVCAAAGGDLEGLIFSNIGPGGTPNAGVDLRKGIVVRNVRVLCRTPTAAVHCILVESAESPLVEGCETVFGGTGIVLKSRKGTIRLCRGRGHGVAPGLIKSDAYSMAQDNIIQDCQASSITGADTGPYRVQAATASTARNSLRDTRVEGTTQWVSIETLGANSNSDVKVQGGSAEGTRFGGITVARTDSGSGAISGVTIEGVTINNVAELVGSEEYIGNGVFLGSSVSRVNIANAQIYGTAGDGVRSRAADVIVTGSTALAPGVGKYGFNALAGAMKVPSSGNIGTTSGSVTTS